MIKKRKHLLAKPYLWGWNNKNAESTSKRHDSPSKHDARHTCVWKQWGMGRGDTRSHTVRCVVHRSRYGGKKGLENFKLIRTYVRKYASSVWWLDTRYSSFSEQISIHTFFLYPRRRYLLRFSLVSSICRIRFVVCLVQLHMPREHGSLTYYLILYIWTIFPETDLPTSNAFNLLCALSASREL